MGIDQLLRLPASSFRAAPPDALWQQVNVALVRVDGDAVPSARAMFRKLVPLLNQWHHEGRLHGWFFMRKPPDVRLRCYLRPNRGHASAALDSAFQSLQNAGLIDRWFRSHYQPEQSRFGGPEVMARVHAYFFVDSMLWLHLDELDRLLERKVAPGLLLPANLHHLFQCCCGAERAIEAWRVLARLTMQPAIAVTPPPPQLPAALEALAGHEVLAPREALALRAYARSNHLFSQGLLGGGSDTVLARPVAEIAATVALFNLNRHGFPGGRSGPMTARVLAALGDDVSRLN